MRGQTKVKEKKEENYLKLKNYFPLINGLGKALGTNCEILLHDASAPEKSIIACENGHVSGRSIGGPMTDYGLALLKAKEYKDKDGAYNYFTRLEDGRCLKCNAIFIRDENNEIIGIICINEDITNLVKAQEALEEVTGLSKNNHELKREPVRETYAPELEDLVQNMLEQARLKMKKPLCYLDKNERMKVVEELNANGFFLLKGAVEVLAKEMKKTKFTIYNYLRQVDKQ